MSFGKFFASCFTGSMLGAGPDVFAVWAYCISNAVAAQVELNPKLLALSIGMSVERVNAAIKFLCSPDPDSRNKEHDGKRLIKEGEFAYHVVSHDIYRAIRDEDGRREYMRKYMKERRAKAKLKAVNGVSSGEQRQPRLAQAEAEAEAEAEGEGDLIGTHPSPLPPDPVFGNDPPPTPITEGRKRVPVSDVDRISHAGGIVTREDAGKWQLLAEDHSLEQITAAIRTAVAAGEKPWHSTIHRALTGIAHGRANGRSLPAGLPTHVTIEDP